MLSLTAGAGIQLVKFYGTNEVNKDRLYYTLYYHRKSSLPSTRLFLKESNHMTEKYFKDTSESWLPPLCKSSHGFFAYAVSHKEKVEVDKIFGLNRVKG